MPAAVAATPGYGIYLYSSFCYSPISGDIGGNRLILIRQGDDDRLYWEFNDGASEPPIPEYPVKIDSRTSQITFDVDFAFSGLLSSQGLRPEIKRFGGTISEDAVVLDVFEGRVEKHVLPRVKDFAAKTGGCK